MGDRSQQMHDAGVAAMAGLLASCRHYRQENDRLQAMLNAALQEKQQLRSLHAQALSHNKGLREIAQQKETLCVQLESHKLAAAQLQRGNAELVQKLCAARDMARCSLQPPTPAHAPQQPVASPSPPQPPAAVPASPSPAPPQAPARAGVAHAALALLDLAGEVPRSQQASPSPPQPQAPPAQTNVRQRRDLVQVVPSLPRQQLAQWQPLGPVPPSCPQDTLSNDARLTPGKRARDHACNGLPRLGRDEHGEVLLMSDAFRVGLEDCPALAELNKDADVVWLLNLVPSLGNVGDERRRRGVVKSKVFALLVAHGFIQPPGGPMRVGLRTKRAHGRYQEAFPWDGTLLQLGEHAMKAWEHAMLHVCLEDGQPAVYVMLRAPFRWAYYACANYRVLGFRMKVGHTGTRIECRMRAAAPALPPTPRATPRATKRARVEQPEVAAAPVAAVQRAEAAAETEAGGEEEEIDGERGEEIDEERGEEIDEAISETDGDSDFEIVDITS